ncbi:PTS sugar transporter subunit IIC [Erysipelothrix sp. HDW6C]|uniref:PTS sugar transporter subunit IIC n=1 Tax=Erysipelothrix sp. HDW6C TaxID=2714930 RepID=UPI00140B97EB|nr:PTS transporter subunit EIIC [Erysipelothrix sp. HDW6C]QIK69491.1 PTS sugar transporter subunit IIC [Erysipelothrix sp. HDW6C]
MKLIEKFLNKIIAPIANYMSQSLFFGSLSEAFMRTTPITVGASVLMIIGNFPVPAWIEFITNLGLMEHFNAVVGASTNAIAIFVVFNFAYIYATKSKQNGLSAGLISLASFFILIPQKIGVLDTLVNKAYLPEGMYETITTSLEPLMSQGVFTGATGFTEFYISGTGIFVALFVAAVTAILFVKLNERNFTIKLPATVPSNVSESLSPSLIAGVIFILFFAIRIGLSYTSYGDIFHLVFGLIQQPLQGFAATPFSVIFLFTLANLFWFFGIHPNIIFAVITPLLAGIRPESIAAFQNGVNPMPYISISIISLVHFSFGGGGVTYGWLISSFTAKSEQNKTLRRLALVPGIFNINEPLIFGAPIMMNPIYFIPFVFSTAIISSLALLLNTVIGLGVVNPTASMPWTMPGFVVTITTGGLKYLLIAIVVLVASVVLWYPFFKIADAKMYAEEQDISKKELAGNE